MQKLVFNPAPKKHEQALHTTHRQEEQAIKLNWTGFSHTLTMFLKWALRVPVVWWYSITQLLLRISPLLSLQVWRDTKRGGEREEEREKLFMGAQGYTRMLSSKSQKLSAVCVFSRSAATKPSSISHQTDRSGRAARRRNVESGCGPGLNVDSPNPDSAPLPVRGSVGVPAASLR